MIKRSRSLSPRSITIVNKVIQTNAYFAHSENILLCMIHDEDINIRKVGWRRILNARDRDSSETVRCFKLPKIYFDAQEYHGMIDWQVSEVLEPPLTKTMNYYEIKERGSTGETPSFIPKFPCHTQAVERHIKLVTEASTVVCGSEARDGFIKTRVLSRQKMPKIESKQDFKI